ncbi:LpxL/LpxP family acyltransferase [Paucidesulfovibrio longus]|uniref:LpxL/LpxP family acyltransferase n=1 Tax=Paucidesulfovibrio longus TaxID=889 RepID=UPI0003F5CE62|nr:lysophospholipid acyltransferase family protein [Paucidesulfovibrio longus]
MSGWNSASLASSFHHRIFFLAIRYGGRPVAYAMLVFVVFWYTMMPKVRRRSAPYIERRFPGSGAFRRWLRAYRLNLNFGLNLVDRAALGILNDTEFTASEHDKTRIADLLSRGRGVILLTAHVGSWQTALAALDFLDRPRNVVLYRAEGDVDRHYFDHRPDRSPIQVIDPAGPHGGTLEMYAALQRGEALCISGDRILGSDRRNVSANFLGDPIALPTSIYRLASLTGAPVIVVFSRRVHGKRTHIWVEDVIEVPADIDPQPEACRPYAQRFALGLERYVAAFPHQYFNFYNIWDKEN